MSKIASIQKARELKQKKAETALYREGFTPCSPDMTICGDCADNRAKKKCPRLREWLEKHQG